MGGASMSSIMLMATMVVLSWRSNMMERHTTLMLFAMVVMVIMDMVELVVDMELLDKIPISFPDHTVRYLLLFLVRF